MVHTFELFGQSIAVDGGSGSIHLTDGAARLAIEQTARGAAVADSELAQEIKTLTAQGKLFAPDVLNAAGGSRITAAAGDRIAVASRGRITAASRGRITAASRGRITAAPPPIKALCLHTSHTCNLTCAYCFAQAGRYRGKEALMPYEVGKAALDYLVSHSGTHRNLEVDFFGGEPLMNLQVVKDLTAYARSIEKANGKTFRFTLTTNGMLLDDEVTDFCNREMSNVVLSLDGRWEVHDRLRRTVSGSGSYDTIVPKFQAFVKARKQASPGRQSYYIRGTFTHFNTDFTNDLFHMRDLGFDQLSMEPVVCAPDSPYALTAEDLETVKSQYELLARYMAEHRDFAFYHFNIDLKHGPCIYKRLKGCGSGTEYLAVTPTGDFYPCHQFVGERDFLVGNVWDGITHPDICADFGRCTVLDKPDCRDCWARLWCAGGCAANAYHDSGYIQGVHRDGCELFRKRLECAIWLQTVPKEKRP